MKNTDSTGTETVLFGAGCFWCVEAIFQSLKGVISAEPGYSGGTVRNPDYEQVCTGKTGHAEVIRVVYDPEIISFRDLLEVFWQTHDPTTLNRQGADIGTQYRSVIFYNSRQQKELAEHFKNELNASGAFEKPVVTEISPAEEFYMAEDYHRNYFVNNPEKAYCRAVIQPKVEKFRKVFRDKLIE